VKLEPLSLTAINNITGSGVPTRYMVFIFRRLKINYDTYEFILDSGTVAKSNCLMRNHQSMLKEIKYENGIKGDNKYAPAILNSSDLSIGIHCNCSQTRDTIPLISPVKNLCTDVS
jgi:hypothetical protein